MKRLILVACLLTALATVSVAQRTDLAGLKFCIDPGHGGHSDYDDRHLIPDPGVNFYESESNFQKALHLKALLEARGATVLLTRYTNDYPIDPGTGRDNEPSLSTRVEYANSNNVDWFHSIHSNAAGGTNTGINYTLMLVREKRSTTDRYASSGNGMGVTENPESDVMAKIIGPNIKAKNRTTRSDFYRDWTFYGGVNGGFSLGVLRGLAMPGELSEGSFHDYMPETRRLMNNEYRKMEAYAIRDAFMQYYGVPADTRCIVAGIQVDLASSLPMNNTTVRIMPENKVYHGDNYNNGYFFFDSLQAGNHTVRFEITGFDVDSVQITVAAGQTVFVDRTLESTLPPRLLSSTPVQNEPGFMPNGTITLNFSKRVQRAIAEPNIYLLDLAGTSVPGTYTWSNYDAIVKFKPTNLLAMDVTYRMVVGSQVKDLHDVMFDGNGDGVPGDSLIITFKTRIADVTPPSITAYYPRTDIDHPSAGSVINATFSEPLNPASVTISNLVAGNPGLTARTVEHHRYGTKSGVNIYVTDGILPGGSYVARVSGVADTAGNVFLSSFLWQFVTVPEPSQTTVIEDFDSAKAKWDSPSPSANSVGLDSVLVASSTKKIPILATSTNAGEFRYFWNTAASDWLFDQELPSTAARSVTWRKKGARLQAYVLGDGSGNLLRFVVDDSVDAFPTGRTINREVSAWKTIDWVGWRMLEWDMAKDTLGTWTGNGILEGTIRLHGFQLKYGLGSALRAGQITIDQIQVSTEIPTSVEDRLTGIPDRFDLKQNYPNPFNPSTMVNFQLPIAANVRLSVFDLLGREVVALVNEKKNAGQYSVQWDASRFPSGIYFYTMQAGEFRETKRMILLK